MTHPSVAEFGAERARLVRLASGILHDSHEAEDAVQDAWLRFSRAAEPIDNAPAWLTTVTTRLCLDRLRSTSRAETSPITRDSDLRDASAEPAEHAVLADSVGVALRVVLDRLTPSERVAFVLHDTFGFSFATIAQIMDASDVAVRKLASRARAKVGTATADGAPADWQVVDAFLAAARGGDFDRLLELLAPQVIVTADPAAIMTGTPARLEGRDAVAGLFNGAAKSALPVFVDGRPGAAWFLRGAAKVAFDFTVTAGQVTAIVFRADPAALAGLVRRRDGDRVRTDGDRVRPDADA